MTADPLSRASAVFLLVDHQGGVFARESGSAVIFLAHPAG